MSVDMIASSRVLLAEYRDDQAWFMGTPVTASDLEKAPLEIREFIRAVTRLGQKFPQHCPIIAVDGPGVQQVQIGNSLARSHQDLPWGKFINELIQGTPSSSVLIGPGSLKTQAKALALKDMSFQQSLSFLNL